MAKHITEISLDYDGTFERLRATEYDGFTETSDGATSISTPSIFPVAPPISLSMVDIFNMDTPPAFLGEVKRSYIKFRNSWLPLGAFTEKEMEREERGRREAQAQIRIQRQRQIREAMEKHSENISESFKWMAIGAVIFGLLAMLFIAGLIFLKGDSGTTTDVQQGQHVNPMPTPGQ